MKINNKFDYIIEFFNNARIKINNKIEEELGITKPESNQLINLIKKINLSYIPVWTLESFLYKDYYIQSLIENHEYEEIEKLFIVIFEILNQLDYKIEITENE